MNCANCGEKALWVYDTETIAPIPYCDADLPRFLRPAAKAGTLTKAGTYRDFEGEVAAILMPDAATSKRSRKKSDAALKAAEAAVAAEAAAAEAAAEASAAIEAAAAEQAAEQAALAVEQAAAAQESVDKAAEEPVEA